MPEPSGVKRQQPQIARSARRAASPQGVAVSTGLPAGSLQRARVDPNALTPTMARHLQGVIGNRAVQRLLDQRVPDNVGAPRPMIQPSLQVGAATDRFEREAERVAQHVVQGKGSQAIQRFTKTKSGDGFETTRDFEQQLRRTEGDGKPLPPKTRSDLESSFGTNFSHVRIHTDAKSHQLSRTIQAKAFTHGHNIHFGAGEYNPASTQGKQLLAHELTHTLQQTGGRALQRTPTVPTIQRKLKMVSDDLGDVSFMATGNKLMGDESTFSLLKSALDDYHQSASGGLTAQLTAVTNIINEANAWLQKHRPTTPNTAMGMGMGLDTDTDNNEITKKSKKSTFGKLKGAISSKSEGKKSKKEVLIELLLTEAQEEMNELLAEIAEQPKSQADYLQQLESGKFKYLTGNGVKMPATMKTWYSGQDIEDKYLAGQGARAFKLTREHNITLAEATAIGIYTATDYNYMNPGWTDNKSWMKSSLAGGGGVANKDLESSLKQGVTDDHVAAAGKEGRVHGKYALEGLQKLPDHGGVVYRGEGWPRDMSHYKPGQEVVFDSFLSTSQDAHKAKAYVEKANTKNKDGYLLVLSATKGKNIEGLSDMPPEQEVLFLPGSKFRVNRVNLQNLKEHEQELVKDYGQPPKKYVVYLDQVG